MERVFESYVPAKLESTLPSDVRMTTQEAIHHLFDTPQRFQLKPDIVLHHHDHVTVMDTKWKRLSAARTNYGISQTDMYQMYAYAKKYQASRVIVLYPLVAEIPNKSITYASLDGVTVDIRFVDLSSPEHTKASLQKVVDTIM
jgi:5-methylcytosine-specific restriction enzyme subunit McrC